MLWLVKNLSFDTFFNSQLPFKSNRLLFQRVFWCKENVQKARKLHDSGPKERFIAKILYLSYKVFKFFIIHVMEFACLLTCANLWYYRG